MNRFRDTAIENYARRLTAVILNLVQPEVETFDPPTGKPCHRTKRDVNCMTRCRNVANRHFLRWRPAAILDFLKPQIAPFDPTTTKPYCRTKDEADRMICSRDMAVRNFPKCEVGRSSVGRRSSIYTLFSCTPLRYVRNVAREEQNVTVLPSVQWVKRCKK